MGRTGIVTKEFKGEENTAYHDIIALFKIYRSVNWRMQIKINQVKYSFQMEYGIRRRFLFGQYLSGGYGYKPGSGWREGTVESINRSNKFLKLIDEAVELMRKFHPNGERYYWVLYYSYMSAYKAENVEETWTSWSRTSRRLQGYTGLLIFGGGNRHLRRSAVFYGDMKGRIWSF